MEQIKFIKPMDKVKPGKVDIRTMKRTGKARLRFYGVAPDHLEIILEALKLAREEFNTEYDTVALDSICMHFLNSQK